MRTRLDRPQRVVLVVGLGLASYVLGSWLTNLHSGFTGWTAYAPLQNNSFQLSNGEMHPWVRVVIWILFIVFWTLVSLWLLSRPRPVFDVTREDERG
jgi:heme/copper-type cytochrome/quinol oxidase subunit 1